MIRKPKSILRARSVTLAPGVTLTHRPLTSLSLTGTSHRAAAEVFALTKGAPTRFPWADVLEPDDLAGLCAAGADAIDVAFYYVNAVLLATLTATDLTGVEDEAGAPAPAAFETFAWLFLDADLEAAWRAHTSKDDARWSAEKNGLSAAPPGSTGAALTTAPAAPPPAAPAPAAD